jgi:CPA2 family monovalent cation:H+ antiporter-2
MDDLSLLKDLLVVFVVAAAVVYLFQLLRLPAVVGLLAAGMLVGPHGLTLIHEEENVRLLAEIGVVVLLFTVGLEFSLSRLSRLWHVMLTIAVPQVLICGIASFAATRYYFEAWQPAVFAGMLVAMSSTAVVLKVLIDRGEITSPQGRISVAVLLFQDLLVVGFMLALPVLSLKPAANAPSPILAMEQGIGVMGAILLATRYVIPRLLFAIVKTRNRELFLLAIVALCLGTATLTAAVGLSLALGAFLAGLALSDSQYAQQTLAEVLPFRDTLASLFFVSIGMLLDLGFIAAHPGMVALTVAGLLVLKFFSVAVPLVLSRYPLRLAFTAGLALAQIGEFSFVLAERGKALELLTGDDSQTFLAAAVLTMAITPLVIAAAPKIACYLPEGKTATLPPEDAEVAASLHLDRHVIVCGFGVNGRNVAHTLRETDIPFVVLEMNPVTVREERRAGVPILFGDCSREPVLEHAGIHQAKAMVVAISDPSTTRRAVQIARAMNPKLHILVRTRYMTDVDDLRELGASEIVPEELETSIEVFARLLEHYEVPRNLIWEFVERLRRDHYEALRDDRHAMSRVQMPIEILSQLDVELISIRDSSPAIGQRLDQINLRAETGATLVAVRRGSEMVTNPGPDFVFAARDVAILTGDRKQLDQALFVLDPSLAR